MSVNGLVRARIDADVKERASAALSAMGLTVSDAIRLLLLRVAEEQRLPFDVRKPNRETSDALRELEAGGGVRHADPQALFEDLGI